MAWYGLAQQTEDHEVTTIECYVRAFGETETDLMRLGGTLQMLYPTFRSHRARVLCEQHMTEIDRKLGFEVE